MDLEITLKDKERRIVELEINVRQQPDELNQIKTLDIENKNA